MSEDFKTILIRDSRLENISDKSIFSVSSGSASNTYQSFQSVSGSSNSVLSFNVRPPSESVCFDRCIYVGAHVTYNLNITGVEEGTNIFQYGLNQAMQSFPLNRLFTTVQVQMNNASVSLNSQDCLPALLRTLSTETLQKWQNLTPTLMDTYQRYPDCVGAQNNPLAGYAGASHNHYLLSRGVHPLSQVLSSDASLISAGTGEVYNLTVEVDLIEPLITSPFLWAGCSYNDCSLVGVNNFNLVLNLDSTMKRFWSSAIDPSTYTLSLTSLTNAYVYLNFLTSQPTMALPIKTITPFFDYPRYILSNSNTSTIVSGSHSIVTFSSIQFATMPDRIFIYARKPLSSMTCKDSESFFFINNISINLNVS
jgi:hypothetical protein